MTKIQTFKIFILDLRQNLHLRPSLNPAQDVKLLQPGYYLILRGPKKLISLNCCRFLAPCAKQKGKIREKPTYFKADFTKGLKPGFGLKFKTLVLNSVKNVLSQQA